MSEATLTTMACPWLTRSWSARKWNSAAHVFPLLLPGARPDRGGFSCRPGSVGRRGLAARGPARQPGISAQPVPSGLPERLQGSRLHLFPRQPAELDVSRGHRPAAAVQAARAGQLLDAYLDLSGDLGFDPPKSHGLRNLPASRFLSPYRPGRKRLEPLRLRRIRNAMSGAARSGKSFHLWWHPHNFGLHLEESLAL